MRFPEFEGEWVENEVQDILKIGNGRDYRHLQDGNIPVFGTGGYMTSVNEYLYNGESVCIGRKGTINKPFLLTGKFWTVDTLFYTHSYKGVSPRFVFYTFEQINWLKYNEASGVPSLPKSVIEKIPFSYPSKKEQSKIATFLTLIDQRIETQRKIIEKYESLIKGLSHSLFRKQKRNIKLNDCVTCFSSSLTEKSALEETGEYPVYGAAGIFTNSPNYMVDKDSILIIKDGSNVGKMQYALGRHSTIGTLNYLLPQKRVNLKYIYYYLQTFNFDLYKVGSGIPHIYFRDYGNEYIYCPDIDEQERIANILSVIDNKISLEKSVLDGYMTQKQYLLANMFR